MNTRRDVTVLALAFLIIAAWDATGLDLPISRWFADSHGFAWKDHWLFDGALHDGARWLAWGIGGLLLVNIWFPLPFARGCPQSMRVWWLATTLACVALIPLLKQASLTSCPWSLAEFGGTARYVSHWAFLEPDGGPGRCFPAGHATTGFCFFAGYFALRESAPVVSAYVEKLAAYRITFTPPLLCNAAAILFLVAGKDKADTLAAVLEGASEPDRFPVQGINCTGAGGETLWLLDRAAVARLSQPPA